MGVRAIELAEGDFVVSMIVCDETKDVLTITENGFGKRSPLTEYKVQNRNGKGMKAGVFNEKTGKLVCMKLVSEEDDVMLIADNGIIIRTKVHTISKINRDTMGVKVMKLQEGAKVSCVAVASPVEEETEEDYSETENVDETLENQSQNDEVVEVNEDESLNDDSSIDDNLQNQEEDFEV